METIWRKSLKYVLLGSARQFADPVFGGQPSTLQTRAPQLRVVTEKPERHLPAPPAAGGAP